jgi:hypothetical protein
MTSRTRALRRLAAPLVLAGIAVVALPASPASAYSGSGAAVYADRWAKSVNSNYPDYHSSWWWSSGSDCTNFVSQALHDPTGGGMDYVGGSSTTDDHQWWAHWNGSSFSNSHSWSVAQDFYTFLMWHYPGGWNEGSAHTLSEQQTTYTPNSVVTGDVLFYDWESDGHIDHDGIQVGWGTDPDSKKYGNYQDQHSNDRYHAFWSLIPYNEKWSTTTITFVHVDPRNP